MSFFFKRALCSFIFLRALRALPFLSVSIFFPVLHALTFLYKISNNPEPTATSQEEKEQSRIKEK